MGDILEGIAGLGNMGVNAFSAYKNYNLQKDQLNWQKSQWEEVKQREDNATQRRVADLKAAGLSPTLAAGSASAASPAPVLAAPQMDAKNLISDSAMTAMNLMTMDQNLKTSSAQEDLTRKNIEEANARIIKIGHELKQLDSGTYKNYQEALKIMAEADQKKHDTAYFKKHRLPSSASSTSKTVADLVETAETTGGAVGGALNDVSKNLSKEHWDKQRRDINRAKYLKNTPVHKRQKDYTSPSWKNKGTLD